MTNAETTSRFSSKLRNKRVLVVGGTSGIGFAVAQAAVESGAIVTISSSSEEKIAASIEKLKACTRPDSTYSEQQQQHQNISGHACDLYDLTKLEDNLRSLFDSATGSGTHKLDHIVYTAGNKVGSIKLSAIDAATITDNGILRFYAPILIGKLASAYMASSHESSITLTSGVNNVKPVEGRVLMAGWGAGVEGVTRALAVDLRPIRVNCVCPGPTRTALFDGFPPDVLGPLIERYQSNMLTGVIGSPDDVAEAYVYCMRDRFVDGAVLHTSGGLLLA